MKSKFLTSLLLSLVTLTGLQARADYQCNATTSGGAAEKIVTTLNSNAGMANVELSAAGRQFEFSGPFTSDHSSFGEHLHFALTDSGGASALLDLSSWVLIGRGGCGRAGCVPPLGTKVISAKLSYPVQNLNDELFNCIVK